MKIKYKSGFTLVETVFVFVLVGILITITTPLVVETVQRADLTAAHESLYNALTRAQKLSQSQTNGQKWGVTVYCPPIYSNSYVIGVGNCSSRDTKYDEIIAIAPNINITLNSGDTIQFDVITGNNSSSWNSITLTNGRFSKSIVIYNQTINKDPASLTPNTSGG